MSQLSECADYSSSASTHDVNGRAFWIKGVPPAMNPVILSTNANPVTERQELVSEARIRECNGSILDDTKDFGRRKARQGRRT
jgi:hypothetical protein